MLFIKFQQYNMNFRSTNVRTIQDALCIKGYCACTLECVSIYFRIRAQVAYILIMPLANCQQLNDSIFF